MDTLKAMLLKGQVVQYMSKENLPTTQLHPSFMTTVQTKPAAEQYFSIIWPKTINLKAFSDTITESMVQESSFTTKQTTINSIVISDLM